MTKESPKRAKFFRVGGVILILLFLLGGIAYYVLKNMRDTSKENTTPPVEISIPETKKDVFVNDVSGVQEITDKNNDVKGFAESENYVLKAINLGGYEIDMSGEAKSTPLKISDVRGETMVSKDGKQTKLLFSWKTSKLATADVTYAKNDGPIKTTVSEKGPGFYHALVLNFEPATRYTYFIVAKDRWGNKVSSEKFSAYTSLKNENIIDIITQQLKQIFSWTGIKQFESKIKR